MKLEDKDKELYKKLPKWVRRDLLKLGGPGWIFSGNEILGWDWTPNILDRIPDFWDRIPELDKYWVDYEKNKLFIPSEVYNYFKYIKSLLVPSDDELEVIVKKDGSDIVIGIDLTDCDQQPEVIFGIGSSRLSALLDLTYNVSGFYWANHCPSINDIKSDMQSENENSIILKLYNSLDNSIDIFENEDGEPCINFPNHYSAELFIRKFERFVQDVPEIENDGSDPESYHGRVNMIEGLMHIYSSNKMNLYPSNAKSVSPEMKNWNVYCNTYTESAGSSKLKIKYK